MDNALIIKRQKEQVLLFGPVELNLKHTNLD